MDLKKLFEMQKVLRDRINYHEPDRFNKLILALLVELGECANEWRGFKFWSKDLEPRTKRKVICHACKGLGEFHQQVFSGNEHVDDEYEDCMYCGGTGFQEDKNPLLEEYVDGLHFVLEIGLELGYQPIYVQTYKYENVTRQFKELYWEISDLDKSSNKVDYLYMFQKFVGLGEMLDFTWEQIEQAYFAKNAINHERQDNGY